MMWYNQISLKAPRAVQIMKIIENYLHFSEIRMALNTSCKDKNVWSSQKYIFINKIQILFYSLELLKMQKTQSQYLQELLQTDYWYSGPQLSWRILSISCLKGWRQPSSSMHHKPELIANQSNKLQLISKPISNFSCSSCLHLLRGKMWDDGKWFLVNI